MRSILLVPGALLAIAAVPAAAAQTPDAAAERIARVESSILPNVRVRGRSYAPATIEERMRSYGVPAVSIAVVHDGEVQWAKAYGLADVESGRPATTGTLFQAASMSKPVAAMAALRLVQEGKLALDEPVNDRLVSWKIPASEHTANRPVTLRDLLTHSAGLTVHGFPGYEAGEPVPTVVQVLNGEAPANTKAVRVDTEPGTLWRYSGGGTTVVQLLLSDVTGKPFPAVMRESVLEPIGMTSSTYEQPLPAGRADEAATAYHADGTPVPGRYHTYPEMAAAGLWTTPTDLARYLIEVQRSLAGRSNKVLTRETVTAMLTPGVGGWGLGPGLQGEGDTLIFQHGGANEGYRGQFFGFAHRAEGVVVMTNSDAGGGLAAEIALAVADEYGWPGFAPRELVAAEVPEAVLAEYAGGYSLADQGVRVTVTVEDGALVVALPGSERMTLVALGDDRFADERTGTGFRFVRGADGVVSGMSVGGTELRRDP